MPLKFLRAQSTRLVFILTMVCATQAPLVAQTPLLAGTYVQTFDAIGGGAPAGWGIYTGATASSLGTAATLNTAAASWASTTGQWANFAAAGSFLGTETVAAQAAAPNRALGIRQTGSFGDPGASAAFNFSTLGLQISSISFFAQLLSVQTRSTVWSLQYGVGAAPVSWTTIGTFSDPAVFGATTLTAAGFGTNLDNQPNVWLRIVALAGSTGSGSRDTFGIDDFTIVAGVPGGDIAPSIITEPQSLSVTEGGAAQFTVAASGTEPLVYQWRKGTTILSDAGNLTGTNSTMLTLSPVALADAGNYNVVVTNGAGSKTSMDAALTVNPAVSAPSITTQPAPTTVAPGGTAMFHVVADGTAPLAYQWRKGGANLIDGGIITGATTDTLTLTGISAADAGSFDVVVSNAVDSVASGPALLTVGSAPPVSSELLWNFTTATPSSGMPADVTNGTVTQGNNNGTTTLLTTTSASSGYAGVSGTFNAGAAAFVGGPLNQAVNTYFTFTLEPAAGKQLSASALSFGSRSTGTGPQAFAVFTSVDNFTTAVATGTLLNNSTWALQSPTFTSVTGGTSDPITFRIYGYGGAGSPAAGTANWRIDDLKLAISTVDGPPVPPAITGTTPAAGAVGIAEGSSVTVTFNQPVTVTGNWFTLTGSLSGAHTATVTGGATSYILTPDTPFTEGETITLVVLADHVVDAKSGTLALGSDYTATYTVISTRPIHAIQGSGLTSPFATQTVRVHGVVTAVFQTAGQIGGYYMEAPDAEQDTDATTSEGIYVFDSVNGVSVGDAVTVTGKLTEFGAAPNSETEISPVTVFAKESSGNALPTPIALTLPFASTTTAERYEGMRVILPQILTVTDTFDLGHFGELRLSNGRLPAPTNVVSPGGPAQLQEAANLLNQVILDDTLSPTYPSPTPYLNSSDASVATRRSGDTTTGVTGILGNKFGAYVIEPTVVPTFANANPRPTAPVVGGSLHVAIGNVLNFFNGNGTGQDGAAGGFPTERGATTRDEYLRQRAKMVAGILGLRPDIMGLTEVENDGFGPTSAIQDIVTSLNAAAPAGTTYALVNAGVAAIGTDAITCAFIYRTQAVELVGAPVINNDSVFNRPPIAQTFRQIATGEKLTVCINHFK
ncbi:MAG: ExeM/NucH family extracellular endonuclease [Opitutus sp.]